MLIDPPWSTVDGFEDERFQFGLAFHVPGVGTVRVSRANTDELLLATIVGRTADGRHVAGVDATWTGSSSVKFLSGHGTREVQFQLVASGDATISAEVVGTLAMAQISAR